MSSANPTCAAIKQAVEDVKIAAEIIIRRWDEYGLSKWGDGPLVARALLSAYEREEKMLAVVQEAIDGRPPREWIQRMADLYAEAKLAAIKAIEEGRG